MYLWESSSLSLGQYSLRCSCFTFDINLSSWGLNLTDWSCSYIRTTVLTGELNYLFLYPHKWFQSSSEALLCVVPRLSAATLRWRRNAFSITPLIQYGKASPLLHVCWTDIPFFKLLWNCNGHASCFLKSCICGWQGGFIQNLICEEKISFI